MSSESDPVVDDVLRSAHAAASPAPAELARAFAGIRQQIAVPQRSIEERNAARGESARAVPAGRAARWGAELRRLLGTGLALGVGFALGVQYERRSVPAEPPRSSLPALVRTPPQTADPAAAGQLPTPAAEAIQLPARALGATESVLHAAGVSAVSRSEESVFASRRADASKHRAPAHPKVATRRHVDPPLPSAIEPAPFSFSEVVERVERAQHAERDLHPELALELLDEVDARADATLLREERLMTRVLADCDLGKVAAAQHTLSELQSSTEASVYASRIAQSCVAPRPNGARPSSNLQ